ncbi:MAG: flagellar hook-length control protein FliK [Rhizobacter sp.]|nr:flagellar hook-length control protein FliK [Rhizobacter sp.]
MSPLKTASPRTERASPAEPAAQAPSAGHAPAGNADPAGFASMLRHSQAVAASQAAPASATATPAAKTGPPTGTADSREPADAEAPDDTQPTGAAQRPAPSATGKPRNATQAGPAARGARPAASGVDKPASDAADAGPSTPAASTQRADTGAAPDPALLQWIAALPREPARPLEARHTTGSGTGFGDDAATDDAQGLGPAAPGSARTDALTGADHDAMARPPGTGSGTSASANANATGPGFAAMLAAEPGPGTPPAAEPLRAVNAAADAALTAAAAVTTMTAANRLDTSSPVAVAVPTPVNAPEFQQALGLQLSLLARDGVQHAELHLNPAGMGPVSVQIVMDGTQARVDFGADVAATREAIEAGLPALASAMHDAGFTLAGGGVSQQSRGRGDGSERGSEPGAGPRARRIGGSGAADAAVAGAQRAVRRTVTVGGVDLYA